MTLWMAANAVGSQNTFAKGLPYPSPVLPAQLLRLRLQQLEHLRNNTNLEGEWRISSSRGVLQVYQRGRWTGTTRSLGIPTIHGHGFLPLLRPTYGPGRHSVSTLATEKASMASRAANH